MKANELRIGNLVAYGVRPVPIKTIHTESVLKKEVHVCVELNEDFNHYCIAVSEVKPIPLTEEWLLKFGFTRHHADYYNDVILLKDGINFDNGEQYDCLKVKIYPHELGSAQSVKGDLQIKYVHQLQNLYFALTGEELTYGGNKWKQW